MADDEREAYLTAKRAENYAISNQMAEKSGRLGLFMAYPPLSIGDNSMYQQKKGKLDEFSSWLISLLGVYSETGPR